MCRNSTVECRSHIGDEEQAKAGTWASLARLIGFAQLRQHLRWKSRPRIRDGQPQRIALMVYVEPDPSGRGLQRVIEHVIDHLLDRRIRHYRQIFAESVLVCEPRDRTCLAPLFYKIIEERPDGRCDRRVTTRLSS